MTDFAKTKDLAEQISNAAATIDEESQHAWFVGLMSRVSGLGNEPLSSAVADTLLYRAATYPEVFCSDKQAWAVACAAGEVRAESFKSLRIIAGRRKNGIFAIVL